MRELIVVIGGVDTVDNPAAARRPGHLPCGRARGRAGDGHRRGVGGHRSSPGLRRPAQLVHRLAHTVVLRPAGLPGPPRAPPTLHSPRGMQGRPRIALGQCRLRARPPPSLRSRAKGDPLTTGCGPGRSPVRPGAWATRLSTGWVWRWGQAASIRDPAGTTRRPTGLSTGCGSVDRGPSGKLREDPLRVTTWSPGTHRWGEICGQARVRDPDDGIYVSMRYLVDRTIVRDRQPTCCLIRLVSSVTWL